MSEQRVLASYNPNSTATIRFREAQAAAPLDALLADLGTLQMALDDVSVRYMDALSTGRLLTATVEDRVRLLLMQEIKRIQEVVETR